MIIVKRESHLPNKQVEKKSTRGKKFNYLLPDFVNTIFYQARMYTFLIYHIYILCLTRFNGTQGYFIPSITNASK